jgi:hypothetical protein
VNAKDDQGFTPLDSVLSNYDPMPDPFTGRTSKPKITPEAKSTIAFLRSKGAKSMTAKQRAAEMWGG